MSTRPVSLASRRVSAGTSCRTAGRRVRDVGPEVRARTTGALCSLAAGHGAGVRVVVLGLPETWAPAWSRRCPAIRMSRRCWAIQARATRGTIIEITAA
jgi:hypothetical protein